MSNMMEKENFFSSFCVREEELSTTCIFPKAVFEESKAERHPFQLLTKNVSKDKLLDRCYDQSLISAQTQLEILKSFQLLAGPCQKKISKAYTLRAYQKTNYAIKCLKGDQNILQKTTLLLTTGKKILFLDLENTILITKQTGHSIQILFRPGIIHFLTTGNQFYEISIFSEENQEFVQKVKQKLNQSATIIRNSLSRRYCVKTKKGKIIKDLRVVKNGNMKDMVVMDDDVVAFGLQLNNGIPIVAFTGNMDDGALIQMEKVLIRMAKADDVRDYLARIINIKQLADISKEVAAQFAEE